MYKRSNFGCLPVALWRKIMETLKALIFNYHCAKFSQQRSFFFLYYHIYRTLDIVQGSTIKQFVVTFIDSSSRPEVSLKISQN